MRIHNFQAVKILRIEFWVILCASMAMTSWFLCDSVVWGHHVSKNFQVTVDREVYSVSEKLLMIHLLWPFWKMKLWLVTCLEKYLVIPEKTWSYSMWYTKHQVCKILGFKDYPWKNKTWHTTKFSAHMVATTL